MPRRLASQVHLTTARLLQSRVLPTPPVWYDAVMMYPPVPLPPREAVHRTRYHRDKDLASQIVGPRIPFDLPAHSLTQSALEQSRKRTKPSRPRAAPVEYTADRIRRQFFRDHPFEALRPQTLVESESIRELHPAQGKSWTRLRQHGRNPSPEDAVQFAVNLYEHHDMPLSVAYQTAAAQFRSLRSELAVASQFALNEAKFFGADFASSELERGADLTKRALASWSRTGSGGRRKTESIRHRFFPVWKARTGTEGYWSRGVGYTKRWVRGMPPMFWPSKDERRAKRAAQLAVEAPKRLAEERAAQVVVRQTPTMASPIQ